MAEEVKAHLIAFRVTSAELRQIETAASACGDDSASEWSRKIILVKAGEDAPLTKNERVIFEEVARTRMMILHGFMLLAKAKLTEAEWKEIIDLTSKHGGKIGDRFLAQQVSGGAL